MDERLASLLLVLAGAGFFGVVGAAFGAAACGLARRNGLAAGGFVGRTVVAAFARTAGKRLSPVAESALIGAADGASFLGAVGALAGAVAGRTGAVSFEAAGYVALGTFGLALGAVLFGVLAYGIVRAGVRAVGGLFFGGVLGAVVGARLAGVGGLYLGVVLGGVAGVVPLALAGKPTEPEREEEPLPEEDETWPTNP